MGRTGRRIRATSPLPPNRLVLRKAAGLLSVVYQTGAANSFGNEWRSGKVGGNAGSCIACEACAVSRLQSRKASSKEEDFDSVQRVHPYVRSAEERLLAKVVVTDGTESWWVNPR